MKKVLLALGALIFAIGCSAPGPTFDTNQSIETTRSFTCQEYTATNLTHKNAGRAYTLYLYYYYAAGSNTYLGLSSASTTLAETAPGYFIKGNCPASEDTTAPAVSITSPANGSTVSGVISIAADASDNVEVTKVEFYVNGFLHATDTTAPFAADLDTSICSNTTHTLTAKAYDAAGNSTVSAEVYVNIFNNSLTFNSVEEEDGYVKANADGSSAAIGTLSDLAIGRGSDGKFNRTLLSFDTSGLPDGAAITRAYLTVTYGSKSGDAWASGNSLVIDVKFGTFGGGTTELGDWASAATANAVAAIDSFASGTKQSSDFSSAGLAAINDFGMTQLKLRFVNNQTSTAYIFIKSGAGAKLTVEYEL